MSDASGRANRPVYDKRTYDIYEHVFISPKAGDPHGSGSRASNSSGASFDILFAADLKLPEDAHPSRLATGEKTADQEMVDAALTELRMQAGLDNFDSIELLTNLVVREDYVGRKVQNILFDLFSRSGSNTTADEIARQSFELYKLATPTLSVTPLLGDPAAATAVEVKAAPQPKGIITLADGRCGREYFSDNYKNTESPSGFPLSAKFFYMAGAGAHVRAEEKRAATSPAQKAFDAAKLSLSRAQNDTQAVERMIRLLESGGPDPDALQQAKSNLVSSQRELASTREHVQLARKHLDEVRVEAATATQIAGEIGEQLVANGAFGEEIKAAPATLWDRNRLLDNKEVTAMIKDKLTEVRSTTEAICAPYELRELANDEINIVDGLRREAEASGSHSLNFPVNIHHHWILLNARKADGDKWELTLFTSQKQYSANGVGQRYFDHPDAKTYLPIIAKKFGVNSPAAIKMVEVDLQGQPAPNACGLYVASAIHALALQPAQSAKDVLGGMAPSTFPTSAKRQQFNINSRRQLFGAMTEQAEAEAHKQAKVRPLPGSSPVVRA